MAKCANAAYSNVLKLIMDSVKPYLDKRLKGDMSWRYPMIVITILRKVCDTAIMSAGRYDNQRPKHRVYDVECSRDGLRFTGNLICTGLLHRDDPDDVSTFDEYDMTLSLAYAGKAPNSTSNKARTVGPGGEYVTLASSNPVVQNALMAQNGNSSVADAVRVKVVCETETLFGTRREEKTMTVAELRAAFAKVGSSRLFNDVMNDFSAGRDANPLLRLPCETWITRP